MMSQTNEVVATIPSAPPPPNPGLVMEKHVAYMAATLGVTLTPTEHTHAVAMSIPEANEYLIALRKARAATLPSPPLEWLKKLASNRASMEAEVAQANRDMVSCLENARYYAREMQGVLSVAGKHRARIDALMGTSHEAILVGQVQEIVNQGWYVYDQEATNNYNSGRASESWGMVFFTPDIVLSYTNAKAKIDRQVNLGRMQVVYAPHQNKIMVRGLSGNTVVNDHIHPHIGGSSITWCSPCWGDGAGTYQEAMQEMKPSVAFSVLRSILTNYNPGSPYVRFEEYYLRVDKEAARTTPAVIKLHGVNSGTVRFSWIPSRVLPRGWNKSVARKDSDGEPVQSRISNDGTRRVHYCVPIFHVVYEGYEVHHPDYVGQYFVLMDNGKYAPVERAHRYSGYTMSLVNINVPHEAQPFTPDMLTTYAPSGEDDEPIPQVEDGQVEDDDEESDEDIF